MSELFSPRCNRALQGKCKRLQYGCTPAIRLVVHRFMSDMTLPVRQFDSGRAGKDPHLWLAGKQMTRFHQALFTLALAGAASSLAAPGVAQQTRPAISRPEGVCDIYAAAGTPCVTAHSTVRSSPRATLARFTR